VASCGQPLTCLMAGQGGQAAARRIQRKVVHVLVAAVGCLSRNEPTGFIDPAVRYGNLRQLEGRHDPDQENITIPLVVIDRRRQRRGVGAGRKVAPLAGAADGDLHCDWREGLTFEGDRLHGRTISCRRLAVGKPGEQPGTGRVGNRAVTAGITGRAIGIFGAGGSRR